MIYAGWATNLYLTIVILVGVSENVRPLRKTIFFYPLFQIRGVWHETKSIPNKDKNLISAVTFLPHILKARTTDFPIG